MKVITVIGARPQFVKAAVVSKEFLNYSDIEEVIVHTGQHFDSKMSDIFFEQMKIPLPKYNLNINNLGHGAMTGQMLEGIENILLAEKPDCLMIYGDTNSTLAGSLAAKKLHIKVAHVEAGLRSFNMKMPEEVNRILTDRISDLLFCPTDKAIENLKNEGFEHFNCKIVKNGDVMQDAAIYYSRFAQKPDFEVPDKYILATIHRAENTDQTERLFSIFSALLEISETIPVILPIHPRTKIILEREKEKLNFQNSNLKIVEPVGYLEMLYLLKNCSLVTTDSGGLQKEAFFFAKPCVTLREETEWIELVDNGFNVIAGYKKDIILNAFNKMLSTTIDFNINLYGNGQASRVVAEEIRKLC